MELNEVEVTVQIDVTQKTGWSNQKQMDSHAEHISEVSAQHFTGLKDETLVLDEVLEQDKVPGNSSLFQVQYFFILK